MKAIQQFWDLKDTTCEGLTRRIGNNLFGWWIMAWNTICSHALNFWIHIISARKVIFYKRLHVILDKKPCKLLIYLYKTLTTCLIVLIFGSRKFSPLLSEIMHALTGAPVAKSVISMLSHSINCAFLYLIIILSQYYYFPNCLCLINIQAISIK